MTRGAPSATARNTPASSSARVNRRVNVRYPQGPATSTTLTQAPGVLRQVRVFDISQGGIALLLRKPLEAGQSFYIQIKNRILNFSFDLVATVRHATPFTRGRWIVGLEFSRELSPAELASLI